VGYGLAGAKLSSGSAVASSPITKVTAEEYLALDRAAGFRSELIDGEIIAMSGGSSRHSKLQINLALEVESALRGTPCQAFSADLRVRVSPRMYTYPDLTVVCGKPLLADDRQDILLNPKVIFEVLSPSTEHYDRGLKFRSYREINSLTDYILVDQDQARIEQFTRGDAHTWTFRDYQDASELLLIESIGISVPIARIYERIEFPSE
jgi:Uma2 family endonuclease